MTPGLSIQPLQHPPSFLLPPSPKWGRSLLRQEEHSKVHASLLQHLAGYAAQESQKRYLCNTK